MSANDRAIDGRQRRVLSGAGGAVLAALAGDILVALLKFWAAHHTGSSAMLSEGVHSTVDALTEVLLLYGLRTSRHASTAEHPLGFGREVFFWNFIVALAILALGSGVALIDGLRQVLTPRAIASPGVSYAVLVFAFLADTFAIAVAVRDIRAKRRGLGLWRYLRGTRDATLLTVLFSGASGMAGLIAAAGGTFLSVHLGRAECDGLASIFIAVILAVTALVLARGSKTLLIGVPASPEKVEAIMSVVGACGAVHSANGAVTVHLAPDQILVALSVAFQPDLTTKQIEEAVAQLEIDVMSAHPDIVEFLLKPESAQRYRAVQQRRGW